MHVRKISRKKERNEDCSPEISCSLNTDFVEIISTEHPGFFKWHFLSVQYLFIFGVPLLSWYMEPQNSCKQVQGETTPDQCNLKAIKFTGNLHALTFIT